MAATSIIFRRRILGTLVLLFIICGTMAHPFAWLSHHAGYDASLDPIVWSRAFVREATRHPRQFGTANLVQNSGIKRYQRYKPRHMAKHDPMSSGFGKRLRRPSNLW